MYIVFSLIIKIPACNVEHILITPVFPEVTQDITNGGGSDGTVAMHHQQQHVPAASRILIYAWIV